MSWVDACPWVDPCPDLEAMFSLRARGQDILFTLDRSDGLPSTLEESTFPPMSVAEIKRVVAGLPEQERAELAAWLLDSLPAPTSPDVDDLQEAVRRREDLDSGRVAPLAAEQFWSDVDRARAQWK